MSRTRHHRSQRDQHRGDDLWSRRPCAGTLYTAYNKRLSIRKERAAVAAIIDQQLKDCKVVVE